jgi:hypothetical protein
MKFLGIEDFYGNLQWMVDGCSTNAKASINASYATQKGMTTFGQPAYGAAGATAVRSTASGNIRYVIGDVHGGFAIGDGTGGSATTAFCDTATLNNSSLPLIGAIYNTVGARVGMFRCLFALTSLTTTSANYGSRLMFL